MVTSDAIPNLTACGREDSRIEDAAQITAEPADSKPLACLAVIDAPHTGKREKIGRDAETLVELEVTRLETHRYLSPLVSVASVADAISQSEHHCSEKRRFRPAPMRAALSFPAFTAEYSSFADTPPHHSRAASCAFSQRIDS
jgi:hypothetical protein